MNAPVDRQALLRALLRQDFYSFVRKVFLTLSPGQTFVSGWYLRALVHQLERVHRGEIKRLIINMPPRSLKSITTSVAYPAFVLGQNPTKRIICVSYSSELAYKHSNDFRAVLNSPWYQPLFPQTRIGPYKNSEVEVELTRRGFRFATSVGGTLTGRGGDDIVIDDPLKPVDASSDTKRNTANEWLGNTVLSRLDDKRTGAIIIVMQRVHLDDLTGHVLRQSPGEWTVLSLPAIAERAETIPLGNGKFYHRQAGEVLAPDREPLDVLNQMQVHLGSDLFSAQYQQSPVPPGGAMVKRHWLRRYTELPTNRAGMFLVQSWDTAAKGGPDNDWSVCTTWLQAECQWYLIDLWRGKVDYPGLKAKVEELAKRWGAHQVLVEDSATAIALLQELKRRVPGITPIKPERDKATRMSIASAKFEAGQVYFPERASWLGDLEAELFSFPGSRHDDQVDSISQALNHDKSNLWAWLRIGQLDLT